MKQQKLHIQVLLNTLLIVGLYNSFVIASPVLETSEPLDAFELENSEKFPENFPWEAFLTEVIKQEPKSSAEYKEKHELLLNIQMTCKANNVFLQSTQQPLYAAYMKHLVATPEYKQYLLQAIKHGELKNVQLLMSLHDSSDFQREKIPTPYAEALYWAATYDQMDIIQYLINNMYNISLATLLHNIASLSCTHKTKPCVQIVNELLSQGAHIDVRNDRHETALYNAIYNLNMTKCLLKHGANLNVYNIDDETPLHQAVVCGCLHTVEFLLENGANPNTVNIHNETPLMTAKSRGYTKIRRLLHKYGAQ